MTLVALFAMTAGAWADEKVFFPEGSIVYDFEAAANAGENPSNKNGSAANGQAFYGWEKSDWTDSKRQDYKGYKYAEGSKLPEVCHVWRRSDRINGNVAGNGGLKCPSDKEMAVDGLTEGLAVTIIYDATNATNKEIVWAIGDGSSEGGPGEVRAKAIINGAEAVPGTTTIKSGDVITVTKVTPAENGSGYIVFGVKKDMVIKKIIIDEAKAPSGPTVDWNKASKTGTFTMPGGNVELEPEYWPYAELATNGVTAPTFAAAKTEDPLAVVADGAATGGTLMFAFGTETTYPDLDGNDWQTAIPTAENLDAAGGTTYVWYYIKGDDEHSDSEPQRLTIYVQPEPEYTVSMAEGTDDAANWKAGKNDASPTTLPLEGVKKGQTVTVTYTGTKKVLGVKAEKVVKIKTFSIQGPSGNVSPGQTITFTIINIQPAEATNQTFEWTLGSGAPEGTTIESISDDTKTVTVKAGSSMGPITIRATPKDGSGYSNTKQVWLIP